MKNLFLLAILLPLLLVGCGEKDNKLKTFWYENGEMKNQVNFKNGKMDGLLKGWYENGDKKLEKYFKDGKRDGSSVMWYENCLLYTSPSPRDYAASRMPSSA